MHVLTLFNRLCFVFLALTALLIVKPTVASTQNELPEVLVLHSFRTTNPANTDWHLGILEGLSRGSDQPIQVSVEAPDLSRFDDAAYMNDVLDIYRRRFRDQMPDLIIPTYTPALKFLLEYGEELFPGVPIVFCGADSGFVVSQKLLPQMTGIASSPAIKGTIELALQIQPDTQRIAVVVGAGITDRRLDSYTQRALTQFEDTVEIQWLRGLPAAELELAVSELPEHTIILFLIQNEDRTGKPEVPINVLRRMSRVGAAPIYGLWNTLIGEGFIGGRLLNLYEEGVTAGQIGLQVLNGQSPGDIPIIRKTLNPAIFDGQELTRWNIDERLLPADSRILNREPSLWDQYSTQITIIGLVLALQALLILALMINRGRLQRARTDLQEESDRRRQAETTALQFRDELEKFSKERFLGAMATTIAHEINQPLIAIQNYAQAAKRRADGAHPQAAKFSELLNKIEGQAGRAGDIIKNVRALVHADEADTRPTSLNSIIAQVLEIVESELEIRQCRIEYSAEPKLPEVFTDQLQIQLLLVNLLRNAMMSMSANKDQPSKVIHIEVKRYTDELLCVSVTDHGVGISAEQLEIVFEPMHSGGGEGMGMGLAICRMIIDAHGGSIWAEAPPRGGARFNFTLRTIPA